MISVPWQYGQCRTCMIMTSLDWVEGCSDSRTPEEHSRPTPLKHLHSRFLRQARALVILFQGHDQHGVRIIAERHEVRHASDGGAVRGRRQRRLVDGAIRLEEAVIDAVQGPAGLLALRLWPALVLGVEDTTGVVA